MAKERADDGQYQQTVSREDVLDVFADVRGPVVTSADVADALDVTRETARRKLNSLENAGKLAKRKTAGRVVYWRDTGDRSEDTDPIEAALDGWTYGRNEDEQAANRAIARWSLEWLQDNGVAQQGDVPLAEAAEDDPEGRTPDTLWRSVIREAWEHAAKQGYVEQPHSRAYKWAGEG